MTCEITLSIDDLHRAELAQARSDILDAFSELEATVCKILKLADKAQPSGAQFGHKLDAFKKLEGVSQIAKANHPKRDRLVSEIAALLPIRADVVHSRINICLIDREPAAIFINSQNAAEEFPPCRILTLGDLRKLAQKVTCFADEITKLGRVTNPASSPQPPLPDAAGGP